MTSPTEKPIFAIQVKGSGKVADNDLSGLRSFGEEFKKTRKIVVCAEEFKRVTEDGIEITPAKFFFEELWDMKCSEPAFSCLLCRKKTGHSVQKIDVPPRTLNHLEPSQHISIQTLSHEI